MHLARSRFDKRDRVSGIVSTREPSTYILVIRQRRFSKAAMSVIESPMEDLASNTQKSQNLNRKLPLSRVKKIVKMDEDVIAISNAAAQIISASTVGPPFSEDSQ